MIPKKIHYCWFGKGDKPVSFTACLESWEKYCPEFEIKEWNETNAPNKNQTFYKNALRKKKYAFVADSVRANVLYEQGGVYLDTDMLLLKPIESLLEYNFFIGEEVRGRIAFGLFGCIAKHPFLKKMNNFYDQTEFNDFSPPVITHTFSSLINNDTLGENDIILLPDYFYPLPYEAKEEEFIKYTTAHSYAVHLWEHSWKAKLQENSIHLVKKLGSVLKDYIFYGYSKTYTKRYGKEFSRKLYHKLINKNKTQNIKSEINNQSIKVVHITTSPRGGAGMAALRLYQALQNNGVASAYISNKLTINFEGNTLVDSFFKYHKPSLLKRAQLKIKSVFFPSSSQKIHKEIETVKENLDYEMLSTAFSNYKMEDHPLIKEADILHLHWVSGLIDFPTFFSICKKPIVWTLHDMNPFQGLFHYKNDQEKNHNLIGDLDMEQQKIKQTVINQIKTAALVTPSKWMLNQAKNSGVFSNFEYKECISNSVDLDVFKPKDKRALRRQKGFEENTLTLLYISDSEIGYRKGTDLLQKALEQIKGISLHIMVMGKGQLIVENPMVKIIPLGYVSESKEIADYYAMADALIVPSREDNLPNVMLESFACGTPVISFAVGGMIEHIKQEVTGSLAAEITGNAMAETIMNFYKKREVYDQNIIRTYAENNFGFKRQAESYIETYKKLVK